MSPNPSSGPPERLERWVLAWLGDEASTPFVIGDLREEFAAVRSRVGPTRAAAWYLTQGARLALRLRWERRAHPGVPTSVPGRDHLAMDVRQAARSLRRRPGFTAAIVLTVSLAVAATTIAFAVVDGVLLEPLPYRSADRLVAIWERNPRGDNRNVVSPANYLTWREDLSSFDALASIVEGSNTLLYGGEPERVGIVRASASYFEVVGAEPLIGRLYAESDDAPDADPVAVLAEGFWRTRFGTDPSVIGTTLRIGERSLTVIGVLPDAFDFDVEWVFSGIGSRDVWAPPMFPPGARESGGRYLQVIGRLAPGASIESARGEADALAVALAEELPERQQGWGIHVMPLRDDMVGDARPTILVVFGAVCFVLLIACANVANLLLTRASERTQEMAVRNAMGASRGRIVQQLVVEGALLSIFGGTLGVAVAAWGVRAVVAAAPDIPRIDAIGLDATVVAFALLATVGSGLLFGLAPAARLPFMGRGATLSGRRHSSGRETHRLRGALAVAQIALSLVLLVGAGLLTRSLVNRLATGVGFDVSGLVVGDVQTGDQAHPPGGPREAFFEQLVERVQALPGVRGASAITWPPLAGGGSRTTFWPLDRPVPESDQLPGADVRWVHRDYHAVMGIPLLEGRAFSVEDGADAPLVVLMNQTGARQLWPGESALGRRIAMPWGDTLLAEVVGVVADVRFHGPDTAPYPMIYWDHRQLSAFNQMSLVVRVEGDGAEAVVAGMRRELAELDATLPLYNVARMEDLFADAVQRARFATVSLGAFALVALLLAAIGIYGVMSQAAASRTQEIGIRIALGATRRSILRMVVSQGMAQIVVAIALGTAGALALARLLRGLVFDVSTNDPVTFAATTLLLAAVGLLACWLPARRASLADPVETMRRD